MKDRIGNKILNNIFDVLLTALLFAIVIFLSLIVYLRYFKNSERKWKTIAVMDFGTSFTELHLYRQRLEKNSDYIPIVERLTSDEKPIVSRSKELFSSFIDNPDIIIDFLVSNFEYIYDYLTVEQVVDTDLYIFINTDIHTNLSPKVVLIINIIKERLPEKIMFKLKTIQIISKKQESFYKWITLNYSKKQFQYFCDQTVNFIDMEGSSFQIGFESSKNNDKTFMMKYKCKQTDEMKIHYVYTETFIGLGFFESFGMYLDELRKNVTDEYFHCYRKNCHIMLKNIEFKGSGNCDKCLNQISIIFDKYFSRQHIIESYESLKQHLIEENSQNPRITYALPHIISFFENFIFYSGPLFSDFYWSRLEEFCQNECDILKSNLEKNIYITKNINIMSLQCFKGPFVRYMIEKILPLDKKNSVMNYEKSYYEIFDYTLGAIVHLLL